MGIGESMGGSGFRRILNERRGITTVVAGIVIVLAGTFIFVQARGPGRPPAWDKAFYTDDDGKTWFTAGTSEIPPIDHGGRPAYRCRVYRCGGGPPFVNHLEKFDEETKRKMESDPGRSTRSAGLDLMSLKVRVLVRRPGEKEWVSAADPAAAKRFNEIITPGGKDCPPEQIIAVVPR